MAEGIINSTNATLNATNLWNMVSKIPWLEVGYTLVTIAIAVLVSKIIFSFVKIGMEKAAKKTKTKLDDILVREIEGPTHALIAVLALYISLTIYPGMQKYFHYFDLILQSAIILILAYGITKITTSLVKWYVTKRGTGYKYNYLIIVKKIINAAVYILAILLILAQFGIEISPLIASLGIGGLAVALAFQDTLANYFSGIYITTDKDLTIGDYIQVNEGISGTIKEIGWRATKIQTWDGNLVIIPNKVLAESTITDYSKPSAPIKPWFEVAVSYSVKSDKVLKVLRNIISKIKKEHPDMLTDMEPVIRIERFDPYNVVYKVIVEVTNRSNKYAFMAIFNKAVAEAYEKGKLKVDYQVVKLVK